MTEQYKELSGWLPQVIAIAHQAGHAIVEIYNGDFNIEHKSDKSPLTEADMAAHHIIVDGLKALTPDIPVLSEESARIPFAMDRVLVNVLHPARFLYKRTVQLKLLLL